MKHALGVSREQLHIDANQSAHEGNADDAAMSILRGYADDQALAQ